MLIAAYLHCALCYLKWSSDVTWVHRHFPRNKVKRATLENVWHVFESRFKNRQDLNLVIWLVHQTIVSNTWWNLGLHPFRQVHRVCDRYHKQLRVLVTGPIKKVVKQRLLLSYESIKLVNQDDTHSFASLLCVFEHAGWFFPFVASLEKEIYFFFFLEELVQ